MKDELRFIYFHMLEPHGRWYSGNIEEYVVLPMLVTYPSWVRGDQWVVRKDNGEWTHNLGSMQDFVNNLEEV